MVSHLEVRIVGFTTSLSYLELDLRVAHTGAGCQHFADFELWRDRVTYLRNCENGYVESDDISRWVIACVALPIAFSRGSNNVLEKLVVSCYPY